MRYLTAHRNTPRYRAITRYCLERYDQQQFTLSYAEVLQAVRTARGGEETYSEEQCLQDLNELVRFGNLDEDWEEGPRLGHVRRGGVRCTAGPAFGILQSTG